MKEEGSLGTYVKSGISSEQLAYMDRKWVDSISVIYYTISVATFGLPQTTKHLYSKVMDLIVCDSRNKYNTNLDIAEIVLISGVIIGQLKLMQEVYSRLG